MELPLLGAIQWPGLYSIGLSMILALGWSICLLGVILISLMIYRVYLHPLAHIPGPKLAALSNIWQAYHARNGRMLELGKGLHVKYGPMVRIGPNEVWFDSPEAFRIIYGAGNGYEKSDFYLSTVLNKPTMDRHLNLHFPDTLDLLSEFDTKRYRLQRRLIGPVYQTSNIKKFQGAVDGVIERAVAELRSLDGAEVDLKEWMHIIAVECLGAIVLSWSPGYIAARSDGGTSTQGYLGWKRKSVFGLFPLVTTVSFFWKGLGRWFSNLWGVTFPTPKNFKPFFTPVYHKSSKRINVALRENTSNNQITKPTSSNKKKKERSQQQQPDDLLTDLINLHLSKPELFTEPYLRRMAITNFGAGHETLCSALTSVLAMIGSSSCSHHRSVVDVQQKILDELLHSHGFYRQPIDYDTAATKLKYTLATIKESLRLHPVIGMSLSRKVPGPGGGVVLHGRYLPAGTTVGCNPISLHRNTEIFGPDAGEFNPGRWLDNNTSTSTTESGRRRQMDRVNLTWGGGARTCPGRNLAEMVLCKVVPSLVREFEVVVTQMPRRDDEVEVYFMAMLTGVRARFIPRNGG